MNLENLINLQGVMLLLTIVGVVLRKLEIITSESKKLMTDLIIYIALPCSIIVSFNIEFSREILISSAEILIISFVVEIICVFISNTIYKKVPKRQRMILQYGTICSNAGLLGTPVAEGVYGSLGLLFGSIYLLPQRIIMWSAGVAFFTESPDKKTLFKKVATHPCIVSVFIGMAIMVFGIKLPSVLQNTLAGLGACVTPLTMMLIGAMLKEADIKTIITKQTVFFAILRLAILPLGSLILCLVFRVPEVVSGVSVLLAAMPAGTTTAVLALKYNGDEQFATKCVTFTTALSFFTIPVWCVVLGFVL